MPRESFSLMNLTHLDLRILDYLPLYRKFLFSFTKLTGFCHNHASSGSNILYRIWTGNMQNFLIFCIFHKMKAKNLHVISVLIATFCNKLVTTKKFNVLVTLKAKILIWTNSNKTSTHVHLWTCMLTFENRMFNNESINMPVEPIKICM